MQRRVDMNHRLEQREKMLKKQAELEKQGERQARGLELTKGPTESVSNDHSGKEEEQKLMSYEAAFTQIKEATGVIDANEVIQKFLTQEDTRKNLLNLTKDNQSTIERLQEERRRLRLQVDDLKFSSGGSVGRRQQIDDFEKHLVEATEKFDRNRMKYERMAKMLIDMKSGIGHLSEKLGSVKLGDEPPIEMNDDTVEDVLQQYGLKISKLMAKVGHIEEEGEIDDGQYEEKLLRMSQSDVRIKLTDHEGDADDDDDDFEEEMDEDVWNRKHVKYNSEQIMEKQLTKNRRKAKSKKGGAA